MSLIVSPRGFAYLSGDGDSGTSVADAGFTHLWEHYHTKINPLSWGFRREVLESAQRLIHPFDHWLTLQTQSNPHLYGRNFEFLNDTLRFIITGRRRMAPRTWLDLVEEHVKPASGMQSRLDGDLLKSLSSILNDAGGPKATEAVIAKWCSHPRGFEDLLYSVYVMYGSALTPQPT